MIECLHKCGHNANSIERNSYMIKKIISVAAALLLSFLSVNGVLFLYERPVAWIYTPNGASRAVRKPYSILVHGTEGYSISRIDSNGYTNSDYPLREQYVLMMGASHSQGKEIAPQEKYSELVNAELTNGAEELAVYNISCDGHFLPSLINHFMSAVASYPNAKCITIEIGSTDYAVEEFEGALNQPQNVDLRSTEQLFQQLSAPNKLKQFMKEGFPLIAMIKSQQEAALAAHRASQKTGGAAVIDDDEYKTVVKRCLELIRSECDVPILFVYHPSTVIQPDGTLSIERSTTVDIFSELCYADGIDFIDIGDRFLAHYSEYYELPYGFSNTTPGNGHLNQVGHQIMAETILDYLTEVGCR